MRAASLVAGPALCAALLTACDGETTEPPFLPETSPPPEAGGFEGFREFATLVDEAASNGDWTPLLDRAATGLIYSRADVDIVVPRTEVRSIFERFIAEARPDETDRFGSGEATLYAIAKRATEPDSEESYYAILTAITLRGDQEAPYRTIAAYEFAFRNSRWRILAILDDPHVFSSEAAWLNGRCDICFDHWERWEGAP